MDELLMDGLGAFPLFMLLLWKSCWHVMSKYLSNASSLGLCL